jgi:hypothetical protein
MASEDGRAGQKALAALRKAAGERARSRASGGG